MLYEYTAGGSPHPLHGKTRADSRVRRRCKGGTSRASLFQRIEASRATLYPVNVYLVSRKGVCFECFSVYTAMDGAICDACGFERGTGPFALVA